MALAAIGDALSVGVDCDMGLCFSIGMQKCEQKYEKVKFLNWIMFVKLHLTSETCVTSETLANQRNSTG